MQITIDDLRLLVEGCRSHLPYRGSKPPSSECPTCKNIYNARQRFDRVRDEPLLALGVVAPKIEAPQVSVPAEPQFVGELYTGSFDPRCNFCALQMSHSPTQHHREITAGSRK